MELSTNIVYQIIFVIDYNYISIHLLFFFTVKLSICTLDRLGLISETNVRPKIGRTVVSTQNLEFINMDVSGGYDQISRQVWARVRKFWYRVTSVYALPFW